MRELRLRTGQGQRGGLPDEVVRALRAAHQVHGLAVRDLAKAVGTTPELLDGWSWGRGLPPPRVAARWFALVELSECLTDAAWAAIIGLYGPDADRVRQRQTRRITRERRAQGRDGAQ